MRLLPEFGWMAATARETDRSSRRATDRRRRRIDEAAASPTAPTPPPIAARRAVSGAPRPVICFTASASATCHLQIDGKERLRPITELDVNVIYGMGERKPPSFGSPDDLQFQRDARTT